MTIDRPTTVKENNQSCIRMCKSHDKRTKHIDVMKHFVRQRVEDETAKFRFGPTEMVDSELLTKVLSKAVEVHHR